MRRKQVEEHSQPQDRFRAESEDRGTDQYQDGPGASGWNTCSAQRRSTLPCYTCSGWYL
jgi:hypothetical protein